MLVIRKEQMDAFKTYSLRRFEEKIAQNLKTLIPHESVFAEVPNSSNIKKIEKDKYDALMLTWIRNGINDAKELGYIYETTVQRILIGWWTGQEIVDGLVIPLRYE